MFDYILNSNFKNIYMNIYSYILCRFNNNITLSSLNNFILENKYLLIFFLIIYICILLDNTFILKRKIFIFFYFILLLLLLLFFKGSFLINELFWYTLVLNGSFIFHVCICDWLYRLVKYFDWEYGAFLITRISFIFSSSFLVYILNLLELVSYNYFSQSKSWGKRWFHWLKSFTHNFVILIYILRLILIFFIDLFANYALFLKGLKTYNFTLRNLGKFFIYFTLTLVISWFILGIPRLYFIWFIGVIFYIYRNWNRWLSNLWIRRLYYQMHMDLWEDADFILSNLNNKLDMIYSKDFNYGFLYFLDYAYNVTSPFSIEFHIKSPFIFYSRERLILTFFRSQFKRVISEENHISQDFYDFVFERAFIRLNLQNYEVEYWDRRLKKIYKKTLNLHGV